MAGRPEVAALFVVSALLLLPAAAGAAGSSSEDVPVRGGVAALAEIIPISPAPDRPRFISEAIRVVYSWPQLGPYSNEPMRRRIADFFAGTHAAAPDDSIPVPLTPALWSRAVFRRTITPQDLAGAILSDRSASLVCYGLAGMDDETLQFLADHPALVARLAERSPAAVAAFGESVHVRDGRIIAPGGPDAAAAWESVVGEKLDRPERFLELLFESDRGRLAYLFDVLSHVDPPLLSSTLGGSDALKRLAALARRAFPEWDVAAAPFVRPPADLSAFFARIQAAANVERPAAVWQKIFGDGGGEGVADVAWLADAVVGHPARERERRLELFSFVRRVFGADVAPDDLVAASRTFVAFPALALTLERIGVRTPSTYARAAEQADKITTLDSTRGAIALAQFQGGLALVARLAAVRTIDRPAAESLARDLFALRLDDSGHYSGAVAAWLEQRVAAALPTPPSNSTIDDVLLAGIAGPRRPTAAARVEWEGQRYVVDPGGAELQRLRRARDRQEAVTLTAAIGAASTARRASGAAPSQAADAQLGRALLSLAYACDLGDPDGTILIAGDPSLRHDFGYDVPGRNRRVKAMWDVATIETHKGPWHLVGSALALDLAMAPLALRRISADRVPESPMVNLMQRDGFAATVAVMNGASTTDSDRDRIAEFIERGRARVARLGPEGENVDAVARAVDLDGWRTRALGWTVQHDPRQAPALFSMTELLVLGGGSPAAFDAWGTYAFRTAGCLCPRLAAPADWRRWVGLSQAGLPATLVADLPLHVAVVLHNLHLPAVLARPVLAAAMQDFVDATNPTDGNDWLTLARAAQAVDRTRFEDYVAAATADGPLLPEADASER